MLTFEALHDNFIFLLLEVQGQIDATQQFLLRPTRALRQQISLCCDRTANMQAVVETKCYSKLHSTHALSQGQVSRLRALQKVATHLHLISKFCVNITKQMHHLTIHSKLDPEEFTPFFTDIQDALKLIQPTLDEGNLSRALTICRYEHSLDEKYERVFSKLIEKIDSGKNASGHVTAIFIYRYLERIGDSLLRIGEALICITVGNTLNVSQFDSLQETLSQYGFTGSMHDVDYKAILGSRSGCCIGVVETMQPSNTSRQGSIYKEGSISKIKLEKENIERWQNLFPTLVPNIYGYHEGSDNAALLVELLHGCTLDEIILQADRCIMSEALTELKRTVRNVWEITRQDTEVPTNYIQQLASRLLPVLKIHPSSARDSLSVGGVKAFSTYELIQQCSSLEKSLTAPFSVLIHGDFNMNNIVYNSQLQTVRFIDLYRSRNFDYVQDASVFLVSLFRLPIFEPQLRDRLNQATEQFYNFTRQFALDQNDATFEPRLALALARSFYTSTRFELNQIFAKQMYMSAYYLMEKLLSHNNNWKTFSLPEEILFY
jgi:phosphate uptake regulator